MDQAPGIRVDPDEITYLIDLVRRGVVALYVEPPSDPEEARIWAMRAAPEIGHLDAHVMATRSYGEGDRVPSEEERTRWLLPLAWAIADRWKIRPMEAEPIRQYAEGRECDEEGAKVAILMGSVLLVQGSRKEPTTIRLGRKWITGEDGRKSEVGPMTLEYLHYLRWFVQRSIGIARRSLLEEAGEPEAAPHIDMGDDAGTLSDQMERVSAVYSVAKDDFDRRVMDALAEGLTPAEIAKEAGVAAQTVYTRIRRIRERVKKIA